MKVDLPENVCRYGVLLVKSDGSECREPVRYSHWQDAADFGENEVKANRARGFRIFEREIVRRVWFVMVLHPDKGWMRVGNAYGSRQAAREWLPLVRGAWRGLRTRVSQCTLRWVNGELTDRSRRTLDEKFNLDAPNREVTCK